MSQMQDWLSCQPVGKVIFKLIGVAVTLDITWKEGYLGKVK